MFAAFFLKVFAKDRFLHADQMSAVMLPSTESDPDSFIAQCVHVMNSDYCETALDLEIAGPDAFTLQRYYNSNNYMVGKNVGGWRIFSKTLLVTGRDPQNKECKEPCCVDQF